MDHEMPSQTALATAHARALHQNADQPVILVDPLVGRLIGVTSEQLATTGELPGGGASDRPRRLFFAARARFAEDRVAAAVTAGVRQVVILGAGMDTFAFRNPHPELRVFEVDHPATQTWKRRRLVEADIDVPETVVFVPVDFETDVLAAELESAGFSRDDPAVFVWLGVVFYLTADAAHATLDYIAGQVSSTDVVFDYLQPAVTDEDREHLRRRAERLAAANEPWFSYFTPDDIAKQLRALGFSEIDDRSVAELVDGYTAGTTNFQTDTPDALRASRMLRATRR